MTAESIDTSRLSPILPLTAPSKIPDVLQIMVQLDSELEPAGLAHVRPFNSIYRDLTEEVGHGINSGRFSQPHTVERTVGIFALKYLDELGRYAKGNRAEVSKSWSKLFYDPAIASAPEGVQFLLGMFAHIKLDLPQALCTSEVTDDYYGDYREIVGDMINATAHKLAPQYVPGPRFISEKITSIAVRGIANWREKAWNCGLMLQNADADGDEAKSNKIVDLLDVNTARRSGAMLKVGGLAIHTIDRLMPSAA